MGSDTIGLAELTGRGAGPQSRAFSHRRAEAWDRFAQWSPVAARLCLAALLLLLAASAVVPLERPGGDPPAVTTTRDGRPILGADEYDQDIALYEAAIRRIEAGQHYYDFIATEHRLRHYPVRPGFSVRLPTLAYLEAGLNKLALGVPLSIVIMVASVVVWWRRFGEEPGVGGLRRIATAMAFVGASLAVNRHYYALHELWAGMLLMLSFGLHRAPTLQRPARWRWAFIFAALALFIREHSLPFVLLMGATAAWRREWREAAAWSALVLCFLAVLSVHLAIVSSLVLPGDPLGPSWLALRGLSGWLGNVVESSNLRLLPHWIAGPLAVLTFLGWAGWRSPAGTFAFFIAVGYGVIFMIAGRWDNFYWGAMIAPMLSAGLVFAPRALCSLIDAADFSWKPVKAIAR
ncbi:hypothetical protein [Novosphingobium sp. M1R2S20]|uniref:Glycosyltransferase RgtA/B/C/D-like domain-containing protein n=1 Tax=Novosphingobium rhizovicinum TaxID=3228928 RepID=A0ABV3RD54_9SPHN